VRGENMIKKDEYIQKLHTKFDELNAEIDKLQAKTETVRAEEIAEYQKQIEKLKGKRKTIEKMVEKVRAAGNDSWEELKSDLDREWDALKAALKSVQSKLKESPGKCEY
jgi:uncharacterized coiled-coil DUF342 family protein